MARLESAHDEQKMQAAYRHARQFLSRGASPAEIQSRLIGYGLDRRTATEIVKVVCESDARSRLRRQGGGADPVLQISGGVVFLLGVALFLGNITGLAPTFSYAGYILMGLGGALFAAGGKVL